MGICKISKTEIIALERLGSDNVNKNNAVLVYLFFYYYNFNLFKLFIEITSFFLNSFYKLLQVTGGC